MSLQTTVLIAGGAAVLVALLVALIFNALKAAQFACDDAWSLIDVQLGRRAALVPNLVDTVRGYAEHERALQPALAAARAEMITRQGPSDQAVAAEHAVARCVGDVVGLAEQYPELKASDQFAALQHELADLEDQIAAAREIYNGNVARYRTLRQQVPSSCVASWFGFADRPLFRLPDPREAVPPPVGGRRPA